MFTHIYLGIAEGALAAAKEYVQTRTRPWTGTNVEINTQDPYVVAQFGELVALQAGAQAVTDRAAAALDRAWQLGDALTHVWAEAGSDVEARRLAQEYARRIRQLLR